MSFAKSAGSAPFLRAFRLPSVTFAALDISRRPIPERKLIGFPTEGQVADPSARSETRSLSGICQSLHRTWRKVLAPRGQHAREAERQCLNKRRQSSSGRTLHDTTFSFRSSGKSGCKIARAPPTAAPVPTRYACEEQCLGDVHLRAGDQPLLLTECNQATGNA